MNILTWQVKPLAHPSQYIQEMISTAIITQMWEVFSISDRGIKFTRLMQIHKAVR